MKIIKLHKEDIKNALDLIWTVFEEFEVPEYSNEGIEEFKKFISYDSIVEMMDKGELCFCGCTYNDHLAGVIATRWTNHISLLFVKREYQRRGIARKLFLTVKEICERQDSFTRITVNSSPYATEVYHSLGFVDTGKEKTVNGIKFTPMEYSLKQREKERNRLAVK